jgi:hypothetical protein
MPAITTHASTGLFLMPAMMLSTLVSFSQPWTHHSRRHHTGITRSTVATWLMKRR